MLKILICILMFLLSTQTFAGHFRTPPTMPPIQPTAEVVALADEVMSALSSGRTICWYKPLPVAGSKTVKKSCVTAADLSEDTLNALHDEVGQLKAAYACKMGNVPVESDNDCDGI